MSWSAFTRLPSLRERWVPLPGNPLHILYQFLQYDEYPGDEGYIYWITFLYGYLLGVLFAVIGILSYILNVKFNFLLFSIQVDQANPVTSFLEEYSIHMSQFLLFLAYPFIVFIFKANIDLHKCDILFRASAKIRFSRLRAVILSSVVLMGSWIFSLYLPYTYLYFDREPKSLTGMWVGLLYLPILSGLALHAAVVSTMAIWRYLTPGRLLFKEESNDD